MEIVHGGHEVRYFQKLLGVWSKSRAEAEEVARAVMAELATQKASSARQ